MSISDKKFDFWIARSRNVLLIGKHGVGKTSLVTDAFERAGLRWRYFSTATMDPWVDFIGVPRAVEDENGNHYLDLVRPREFQDDQIEAIFFDEYNRAPKKVRNAVMELIQFKSINGRKFKRLRLVWAAVNPDDDKTEEYDVEPLDAAQKDRFHVHVEIPYLPSKSFFTAKFGGIAKAAIAWWGGLKDEMKNVVSPRRLDYALELYREGGDLRDVLPSSINVSELLSVLTSGPVSQKLDQLMVDKDHEAAEAWLASENNAHAAIACMVKGPEYMAFFLPDLPPERLSALIAENDRALEMAVAALDVPKFRETLESIVSAKQNLTVINKVQHALRKRHKAESIFALSAGNADKPFFRKSAPLDVFRQALDNAKQEKQDTTFYRARHYDRIYRSIPEKMEVADAENALDLLNNFVKRSHSTTIEHASNLVGMINHCMQVIMSDPQGPKTGVAFWKIYRKQKRFGDLFQWFTSDAKRCSRVYNA